MAVSFLWKMYIFQSTAYVIFFPKAWQTAYPISKLCDLALFPAPRLCKSVIIKEPVKYFSPVLN